ncbi:peptide/nickel transport system substrate-binding protein [Pseudaminobacter salicylatoxidans]|uniref:Peptide/nickel transport system substrate-binding protein n=1 Tax=Pseudaminobacter salicylatoxidans TaxID=93369 RepID=A0A316C9I0_PSESE|nr:ABC transporter substrate-binding protein [Pseudaminobacter salicylatoxidans]PWJ86330.1 peptide/nickel transport system substrate-binding protein [Pseudaminobacter salicylatoxidans]
MQEFRISRRAFMAATAAFGAAGALPGIARAAAPQRGGHFRIGIADFGTSDTIDPTTTNTVFQSNLEWQLRNNLAEPGPGGKPVPELAESWEPSKDAKSWAFRIRKGVEFHNGKTLTARDVVYSYQLHTAEGSASVGKSLIASVEDVRADGDDVVIFTLKQGNVGFPAITAYGAFYIVPEGETDFDKGVGTGGYILEEFRPGIRSLVRRNPNYWKQGRAHFDSVEMICMRDPAARANSLITGQIDAYNAVPPQTIALLKRNAGIRINNVASKAHYVFAMPTDVAPFTDNNVRLALKHAIDREDLVKRVLHGYGAVGNDNPLSPAYEMFADLPQTAYDPDKVKFYLGKAGLTQLKVPLAVSETPYAGATDAAVLYKEHAAKAGIDIEVTKLPEDGYWGAVWEQHVFNASRWSGNLNADVMLTQAYSADAIKSQYNETRINDPRIEKLLVEARGEFDDARRKEMYGEIQRILHDEGGALIWAFGNFVDATSSKVQHGELSGVAQLDAARAAERWWFAD